MSTPDAMMEQVVIWLNDYVGYDPLTDAAAWCCLTIPSDLHAAFLSSAAAAGICWGFIVLHRWRRRHSFTASRQ
jgi:hypothetical protein